MKSGASLGSSNVWKARKFLGCHWHSVYVVILKKLDIEVSGEWQKRNEYAHQEVKEGRQLCFAPDLFIFGLCGSLYKNGLHSRAVVAHTFNPSTGEAEAGGSL